MGASIGKACLSPSSSHTHFAHIYGMYGFHGWNPSSQHSGISPSKLKVTGSNPNDPNTLNSGVFCHLEMKSAP